MQRYFIAPSLTNSNRFIGYTYIDTPFSLTAITEELDTVEEVKKVCRQHFKETGNPKSYFIISEPIFNEENDVSCATPE